MVNICISTTQYPDSSASPNQAQAKPGRKKLIWQAIGGDVSEQFETGNKENQGARGIREKKRKS